MDIDKRLEALTQTVELLVSMQVETEKQMMRLGATMDEVANRTSRLEKELASRTGRLEAAMATLAEGMALLTRTAIDHSDRIEKLEGGQAH